jgi:hypothetical protein
MFRFASTGYVARAIVHSTILSVSAHKRCLRWSPDCSVNIGMLTLEQLNVIFGRLARRYIKIFVVVVVTAHGPRHGATVNPRVPLKRLLTTLGIIGSLSPPVPIRSAIFCQLLCSVLRRMSKWRKGVR